MTKQTCCRRAAGWLAPSLGLALVPKCPACVAASVAALTGVGVSIPFAARLRLGLVILCISSLAIVAVRTLVKIRTRRQADKPRRTPPTVNAKPDHQGTLILSDRTARRIRSRTAILAKNAENEGEAARCLRRKRPMSDGTGDLATEAGN